MSSARKNRASGSENQKKRELEDGIMLLAVAEAVGDGGRSEQRVGHELESEGGIWAGRLPRRC